MGRSKRIRPEADPESLALLKTIIRDYPKLKENIEVYETMRKSILAYIRADSVQAQLLGFERYYDLNLAEGDKRALQSYFDAKEKVYLLEEGMKTVPEGRRKKIATDRILQGLSRKQLMQKYEIGYNTVRRAEDEAKQYIGIYINKYMEWKAGALYL